MMRTSCFPGLISNTAKGRFYFKILNSLTIIVHILSFKRLKEICNSFCMTFTSL